MYPLNKPEVFVTFANQKFDEKGKLTDEKTKEFIKQLLEALVAWTRKLGNQLVAVRPAATPGSS